MTAFSLSCRLAARSLTVALGMALISIAAINGAAEAAPSLPEIRTSKANPVPQCVTPDRLMAFLKMRNSNLDPRFRNIATFYKKHGDAWGVRWDYAFFQMAIETNFLTYRAPNGRMGDVDPKQNNFAGIGTTGGGVPGDSFPDVSTGVLGQIQHLVVYSGEQIANPVAQRTQLKQEHILAKSRELNRPVRFSDLARRWAADPKYGGSIEWVADQFRGQYCRGRNAPAAQATETLPWQQTDASPAKAGVERAAPPKKIAVADASSPVRTIWSRSPKQAAPAETAPKATKSAAKAPPKASVKQAKAADAPAVDKKEVAASAPAAQKADTPPDAQLTAPIAHTLPAAEEPAAHFALFAPPAALAGAQIAPVSGPAATIGKVVAASGASEGAVVAPLAIVETHSVRTHSVTVPAVKKPEPPAAAPVAPVTPVEPATVAVAPTVAPASKPPFDPPSGLGVKPGRCVVETATFGGDTTVLVKTEEGADVHYVALSVLDGFEDSMTKSYLASRSSGGESLGTFPTRDAALTKARALCPE